MLVCVFAFDINILWYVMSLSLDLNAVFCVLCLVFWESTNSHHCLYINNQVFGQKCDLSELLLKTF